MSATLGVSALGLATEPVQQTLALGQVNLLLMLLVVADLLTAGALTPEGRTRWWHGFGIGDRGGLKLTPLIFIPYLLLIRRYWQAATAAAVFEGTAALGYAILPPVRADPGRPGLVRADHLLRHRQQALVPGVPLARPAAAGR